MDAFISALFPISILIRNPAARYRALSSPARLRTTPTPCTAIPSIFIRLFKLRPPAFSALAAPLACWSSPRPATVKYPWDRYEYPKVALNRSGASRGASRENEPAIEREARCRRSVTGLTRAQIKSAGDRIVTRDAESRKGSLSLSVCLSLRAGRYLPRAMRSTSE